MIFGAFKPSTLDFLKKSRGAPPINDFDSHLSPDQNVPSQPHPGKVFLANGVQWLIMANMGLFDSRDGCEVIRHGDLLTALTDIINAKYAYELF